MLLERPYMRFVCLFSLLLVLAAPARAADQTLVYDLYAGGFHALDAAIALTEDKGRYDMTVTAQTAKSFRMVAPWSGVFSVNGWLADGKRQPETYKSVSRGSDKTKVKEQVYDRSGRLVSYKATENDEDKTPEEIGAELTPAGITDVLTATLKARDRIEQTGSCAGSSLIFDGDRSFSLAFSNAGPQILTASTYSAYAGEAVECTFVMVPEKGKWKKKKRGWLMLQAQAEALESRPTVWFAKLPGDPSGRYVPVRLQLKTHYGTLLLHLRSAAGADGRIFTPPVKKS